MYPYAIGFDIGIASVGWAVVALDGEDRPFGIINMGSRVLTPPSSPKRAILWRHPGVRLEVRAAACAGTSTAWNASAAFWQRKR